MNEIGPSGSCGPLRYQVIASGCMSCNASVVWNEETRDAVVIDPTDKATNVIDFVKAQQLVARRILLTHGHFDHAADTDRAIRELGCEAALHPDDLSLYVDIPWQAALFGLKLPQQHSTLAAVKDEQVIEVFPGYPISVLHVPGHSAGSVAYFVEEAGWAFVGDTLFYGGVGRTDLPGGSSKQLVASIRERLYALPEQTIAVPGHGSTTTIEREKRLNPFVRAE
jgi:hydroxyacylglutathione hydrolase